MEYHVNDKVIHAREGLSTIISEKNIGGNDYFVVVSDNGGKESIYVLKSRKEEINIDADLCLAMFMIWPIYPANYTSLITITLTDKLLNLDQLICKC